MKFLTTKQIAGEIEDIIRSARKELVIVTPFVKLSQNFYERLEDANNRKINIDFIYGKSNISFEEEEKLQNLKNVNVFFLQNLHAKCYLNESKLIITSMNLYEYSENNREMGVLIEKSVDNRVFKDVLDEVNSIKNKADCFQCSSRNNLSYNNKAFCIRCRKDIYFDINKPLCFNCFKVWESFSNVDYPENFCMICGNRFSSSFENPICNYCGNKKY